MAPTKRRIRKILQDSSPWREQAEYLFLFIALFVCLSLLLWNISSLVSRGYREKRKFSLVQEDIDAQEAENQKLKDELAYVRSDVAAEGGARDVLGMVYEDEETVFIDEGVTSSGADIENTADSENVEESSSSGSNISAWVDLFF